MELMKTYFMSFKTPAAASRWLKKTSGVRFFYRHRAIVVSDKAPAPKSAIIREAPGDVAEHYWQWVRHTVLDELHDEYLANPPTPREREKAVENFLAHIRAIEENEAELVRLKAGKEEAARQVLRTHGKTEVRMGGELYMPGASGGERVFWQRSQRPPPLPEGAGPGRRTSLQRRR